VWNFIGSRPAKAANGRPRPVGNDAEVDMKTLETAVITPERQFDWDRIGVVFVTFGIACSGLATLLYGAGFLIQALSHHV
jgi:hypothetical protein